ncbi:dynamin family protein [Ruegeria profundi]|uniref:dynamin family protein n=1 Tax=Ruegeria profundi TaxID=1685378 RepID=UPI001CD27239|nr:dynamin family protein [Ruegeria profundi]MCA0928344.1 dynamin family protein [Ruegeria profundi]
MAKDTQTRFVSPKAWERIEQWSRRKPIFALMGEFSAGKSTLMNFLLRSHALPTQVTATQLPPVWFSWGKQSAYIQSDDGTREDITLDQLHAIGVNDAQFIRIFLESDILEAVDLIDTPGISDPKISSDVWRRAVGQANGVLWCTHSTQAWRETERATWVSLPERLQHNSLLLVTRADALDAKDRQKVLRRVNREAGHLFNRSILFSARDAIVARDKSGDAELWARSGGGKMVDSFLEITEQIMDHRADMLARYQIDNSLSDEPRIQPTRPKRKAEQDEDAAPLKLVNPVPDAAAAPADEVVTSFPVRPTRVERRNEDSDRDERIDAAKAERLRAEMAAETQASQPVEASEEDELRAFFRDTPSNGLSLADPIDSPKDEGPVDLSDDDELEVDDSTDLLSDVQAEESASSTSDPIMGSSADEPADVSEAVDTSEPNEKRAELSVSSITALLAEQSKGAEDEYEPEPESNSLVDMQVVPLANVTTADDSDAPDESRKTLKDALSVTSETALSAASMWREISADDDLPDDAEGMKKVFNDFLEEFDQIAAEHYARRTKEPVHPVPGASKNGGAERHAL